MRLNEDIEQHSYKQQPSSLDLFNLRKRKLKIKICKIRSVIERVDRDLLGFLFCFGVVWFPVQDPSDNPTPLSSSSREFQNKHKNVILYATGFMTVEFFAKKCFVCKTSMQVNRQIGQALRK